MFVSFIHQYVMLSEMDKTIEKLTKSFAQNLIIFLNIFFPPTKYMSISFKSLKRHSRSFPLFFPLCKYFYCKYTSGRIPEKFYWENNIDFVLLDIIKPVKIKIIFLLTYINETFLVRPILNKNNQAFSSKIIFY